MNKRAVWAAIPALVILVLLAFKCYNMVVPYDSARDSERYEAAMEAKVQQHPNDPAVLLDYANFLYGRGRYSQEIDILRRYHQLTPQSAESLRMLGFAYTGLLDDQTALHYYRKVAQLDSNYPWIHEYMGRCYQRLGDRRSAAKEYEAAIKANPADLFAYIDLHELYQEMGDKKKAAEIMKKYRQARDARVP